MEELDTAHSLIISGFGELQGIGMENDSYFIPQQLLASGFERLLKSYFCLVYEARNGCFPDRSYLKKLGHDLSKLKNTFIEDYFEDHDISLMRDDRTFLKQDLLLDRIIHILSEFGMQARYYNLEIIAGAQKPPIDPKRAWQTMEMDILDPKPYLANKPSNVRFQDYYPRVNARIIARLERMYRAIAMQFIRGEHGGRLRRLSGCNGKFAA